MTTRRGRGWVPVTAAPLLAGCESPLSTLEPAGPGAAAIATIWWVMFWASLAILAFMTAITLYAALRRRAGPAPVRLLIIGGGLMFPGVTVTALLVYGIATGHGFLAAPQDGRALRVEVTAHQWWWEVRYPDAPGGATLHDANELHIPAGRPVDVHITTADVIHSFWVPRLGGKLDAIPGLTNVLRIEADAPGVYRGVCAEFCGAQHARMGFTVHAHEGDAFAAQLAEIAARRPQPAALETAGAQAFADHCARCHSTDSREREPGVGPNLAGVASRGHLGAAWLPNEDGALDQWLRAHQEIKPGNLMPETDHIPDDELAAIVAFLETLR